MNRDGGIHLIALLAIDVARRIDHGVEESLRDIKAMDEIGAFLNVGSDEGEIFLQFRIALACRPYRVLEELLRWFSCVAIKDHITQSHERAFVDFQT